MIFILFFHFFDYVKFTSDNIFNVINLTYREITYHNLINYYMEYNTTNCFANYNEIKSERIYIIKQNEGK